MYKENIDTFDLERKMNVLLNELEQYRMTRSLALAFIKLEESRHWLIDHREKTGH